jgi:Beta-propeller repeat
VSKSTASRGWVRAFCIVPVVAIIATALLVLSPARHRSAGGAASASSVASQAGTVTPAARGRIQASYAALPLAFEQNQGQTDAQVKYMARGDGYTLFLTANDAVFSLYSRSAAGQASAVRRSPELRAKGSPTPRNAQKDSAAVVRMQLVGGNSLAKVSASGQLPGRSNYFLGNDPSKWRSGVARYARVSYQDVYPGVNLAFHGAQRQLEFDFVVAPGASPAPIGFHFTGNQGMKTDDSGNLIISSAAGDVLLHKPVAYQEQNGARQAVDARFALKANNQVSFELGNYDRSRELVIDPSVIYAYSTYLGGTGNDEGFGIAFDSTGAAYVTGETASTDFPGFSSTNKLVGGTDVFVTKIAANGNRGYSTYVGGTGNDSGNSIAVDLAGNAFVAGGTASTDFPAKAGAFQIAIGSGAASNAFVFELDPTGSTLTYCTYLGGTTNDVAFGIALDSSVPPNAYAVGLTSSTNFPIKNQLQTYPGGTHNGFVTKLNPLGSALLYSTYLALGGGPIDSINAVAVDSSGNAYVTGAASGSSFHTTPGAFQTANAGLSDAFVTVIKPDGSGYVYSTFLGGSNNDLGDGIAVDSSGNAYVTGQTSSNTDFKLKSALQGTYGGGTSDAFVSKLNSTGTALMYSTYLGGSLADFAASIAVDGSGNAYVTGQTNSQSGFPTVNPTQSTLKGGFDAFVSEINSTGSALIFSTYLGGSLDEDTGGIAGAIAVDSAGSNIYVTGNTLSTDFPHQSGFQSTNAGLSDAFVVKYAQSNAAQTFSLAATALVPAAVSPGNSATSTVTVTSSTGFSGTVTLGCAVSGPTGAVHVPTCAGSATPGTPGTLTVSTTAATALLRHPANGRSSGLFYAMFLPIGGIALLGFGSRGPSRKKLFGFLLIGLLLSGLILMPACGGGSGGHTGSPGTTAGTYTITVSGTASGATQTGTSPSLTLTVN